MLEGGAIYFEMCTHATIYKWINQKSKLSREYCLAS